MIENTIFEERQRLFQNKIGKFVFAFVLVVHLVFILWGIWTNSFQFQISILASFIIILFLLYVPFLDTRITEKGITVKFVLLFTRHYPWEKIVKSSIRQYKPVKEYGGWGIKGKKPGGMAFNVSGDMGLQLEFTNGKKLLIGTRKPDELERALSKTGHLVP